MNFNSSELDDAIGSKMLGIKRREKISEKYEAESVKHRKGRGVEVTRPGVVALTNSAGDVCEPWPLYVGSDLETCLHNEAVINHANELAKESGMLLLFRPTLGLHETKDATLAVGGEDMRQRLARKSKDRVRRWAFRTKGNVSHISTAGGDHEA